MTTAPATNARRDDHADAAPIVEAEGWNKLARWVIGGVQMIGVGVLVPVAILAVGIPIALAGQLVLWIVGRF